MKILRQNPIHLNIASQLQISGVVKDKIVPYLIHPQTRVTLKLYVCLVAQLNYQTI